jgi:hypothetical protein
MMGFSLENYPMQWPGFGTPRARARRARHRWQRSAPGAPPGQDTLAQSQSFQVCASRCKSVQAVAPKGGVPQKREIAKRLLTSDRKARPVRSAHFSARSHALPREPRDTITARVRVPGVQFVSASAIHTLLKPCVNANLVQLPASRHLCIMFVKCWSIINRPCEPPE